MGQEVAVAGGLGGRRVEAWSTGQVAVRGDHDLTESWVEWRWTAGSPPPPLTLAGHVGWRNPLPSPLDRKSRHHGLEKETTEPSRPLRFP
jgi:hypothetical protein